MVDGHYLENKKKSRYIRNYSAILLYSFTVMYLLASRPQQLFKKLSKALLENFFQ